MRTGKRYLIINADDFGMCDSANQAIFELFAGGFLKSSTLMPPCPGAREAVAFAAAHPEYGIGVHLTHTNEWQERWPWGSLTGGKSLENAAGRMWPESEDFAAHCSVEEAIAESRAQIEFCESRGMQPSHVDSHMGAVYGLDGKPLLLPRTLKLCGEKGYPFRMFSKPLASQCPDQTSMRLFRAACRASAALGKIYHVPMPDYLIFPEHVQTGESYAEFKNNFIEYMLRIPAGISETYIHPALPTDQLRSITGAWQRRGWEYALMKDPELHAAFKTHGIRLISYRELARIRKGK